MKQGMLLFTFLGSVLPSNNLHLFSQFTSAFSLKKFISHILLYFQNYYISPLSMVTNE